MRVCHVVASINRDVGGPAVTVPHLASALSARGLAVDLATLDYQRHGPQTVANGVMVSSTPTGWTTRAFRGWSRTFHHELSAIVQQGVDIVHNHGVWMFPNLYARWTAKAARIPLVISPRGMLEPWSLRNGALKKKLVWQLFERTNLFSADMFHATSRSEAESVRALGLRQPIAVIPNGIEIPDPAQLPDRSVLEELFPQLRNRRWLLFLSRLHPKKGVLELLRMWQTLSQRFSDWHLVLAGPDLNGFGRTVRQAVDDLGVGNSVTLTGMLDGVPKQSAFAGAELFVLPSHSENFGLVIAEALAYGIPVLTTRGVPWSGLTDHECGWWTDLSASEFGNALAEALELPPAVCRAMGERGRSWMQCDFSWDLVAQKMEAAYRYLLDKTDRPEFLMLE